MLQNIQHHPLVKDYARKAQFGQIFTFEKKTGGADGVFLCAFVAC